MPSPIQVFVSSSGNQRYLQRAPFHPRVAYPEYRFGARGEDDNPAYEGVRECFVLAGLDAENFGTRDWNPLRDFIRPGEVVVLKPNMIKERHPRDPDGWEYVLTHGSVIRAVADYVWKALRGSGRIIIADAPQTDSSFKEIVRLLGLDDIRDFYATHGLHVDLIDLRREEWTNQDGIIVERRPLSGDPRGGIAFDLGHASEFATHRGAGRYYGADYDEGLVNRHHTGGRHEYLIAGSVMEADVVFNLPKLKTHKKAGITVALKNLVGINADKNWLPHHTEGDPSAGGDEHPRPGLWHRLERQLARQFKQISLRAPLLGPWLHRHARKVGRHLFGDTENVVRSGNWWGNDTVWRMCLDLNKILFYGSPDGRLRPAEPAQRKRHLVLVDGIIAGEGRGPINPDPFPAGIIAFGLHPASVDAACAWLMGFDPDRIPIVRNAFQARGCPLTEWSWRDVQLVSNKPEWNGLVADVREDSTFHFEPHFGWKGRIERLTAATAASAD